MKIQENTGKMTFGSLFLIFALDSFPTACPDCPHLRLLILSLLKSTKHVCHPRMF